MGGDYIPKSFAPASPDMWQRLSKIIDKDDWYRFVGVTRENASQLLLRDGEQCRVVTVDDGLIEVFQALKVEGSAVAFDRVFEKCWTTTWEECEPFLDYSMAVDDEL